MNTPPSDYGVPHDTSAPLFEADRVTVAFQDVVALEDVSFTLSAGEQVAVVGPNGAGKSTLFKLMVGNIRPNSGTATLYGSSPDQHLCVAYVPQHKALDWSFPVTAADVVMMGRVGKIGMLRWPSRRDRELVRHCLDRVDASHLANRQIGALSGGQQQRIFIARALAQEAELLLLDEPLAGLDLPSQSRFLDLLDKVADEGLTTIVATHDLRMAAERFDTVMFLNKRLIALGLPELVFSAENLTRTFGRNPLTLHDIVPA